MWPWKHYALLSNVWKQPPFTHVRTNTRVNRTHLLYSSNCITALGKRKRAKKNVSWSIRQLWHCKCAFFNSLMYREGKYSLWTSIRTRQNEMKTYVDCKKNLTLNILRYAGEEPYSTNIRKIDLHLLVFGWFNFVVFVETILACNALHSEISVINRKCSFWKWVTPVKADDHPGVSQMTIF